MTTNTATNPTTTATNSTTTAINPSLTARTNGAATLATGTPSFAGTDTHPEYTLSANASTAAKKALLSVFEADREESAAQNKLIKLEASRAKLAKSLSGLKVFEVEQIMFAYAVSITPRMESWSLLCADKTHPMTLFTRMTDVINGKRKATGKMASFSVDALRKHYNKMYKGVKVFKHALSGEDGGVVEYKDIKTVAKALRALLVEHGLWFKTLNPKTQTLEIISKNPEIALPEGYQQMKLIEVMEAVKPAYLAAVLGSEEANTLSGPSGDNAESNASEQANAGPVAGSKASDEHINVVSPLLCAVGAIEQLSPGEVSQLAGLIANASDGPANCLFNELYSILFEQHQDNLANTVVDPIDAIDAEFTAVQMGDDIEAFEAHLHGIN